MRLPLLGLLALTSCSLLGPEDRPTHLDAARQRWRAQHIGAYAYTAERACFCAPDLFPARILVEAGVVVAVLDPETGTTLRLQDERPALEAEPDAYHTIESLFTLIENALHAHVHELVVTYDDARGYPTEIRIDYAENVADDEVIYTVRDLIATDNVRTGGSGTGVMGAQRFQIVP